VASRLALTVTLALVLGWPAVGRAETPRPVDFSAQVMPLLEHYCIGCHSAAHRKGDLALDSYRGRAPTAAASDRELWQTVAERLHAGEMPPEDSKLRPSADEVAVLLRWAEQARAPRDPGRVTIRRLNGAEYDNTIHDLLAIDLKLAEDFPSDDVGYGFDDIGDVLTLPPVLFERYMAAAEQIAERAIVAQIPPPRRRHVVAVDARPLAATRNVQVRLDLEVRGE
jgi:hypothetical protein